MPHTPQRIRLWLILSGVTTFITALLNPMLKTKSQTQSANPESDRYTLGIKILRSRAKFFKNREFNFSQLQIDQKANDINWE
ncbi:MAG: hypothetical protein ACRC8K_01900 [Waterburya sp.]